MSNDANESSWLSFAFFLFGAAATAVLLPPKSRWPVPCPLQKEINYSFKTCIEANKPQTIKQVVLSKADSQTGKREARLTAEKGKTTD